MKRFGLALSFLTLLTAPACEPADEDPTIEGSTPTQAAEVVASVSCEFFAECGLVMTTCTGNSIGDDGEEDDGECTTEMITVDYDECVEEGEEVLGEAFACADLDDEAIALIDECLAEFTQLECMDPEDIDGLGVGGMPEVCAEAMGLLLACTGVGDDSTSPE